MGHTHTVDRLSGNAINFTLIRERNQFHTVQVLGIVRY